MPDGYNSLTLSDSKTNTDYIMNTVLFTIPLFIGGLRGWEIIIIVLVILLLFGGKKIPELMRGLGKGVSSFKQGLREAQDEIEKPDKKDSASSN